MVPIHCLHSALDKQRGRKQLSATSRLLGSPLWSSISPPIWRFIAVLKMAKTSEKTAKEKTLDRSLYLFEHVFRVLPFHLGSCPLLNPQQAYKSFPELKDYMGTPLWSLSHHGGKSESQYFLDYHEAHTPHSRKDVRAVEWLRKHSGAGSMI